MSSSSGWLGGCPAAPKLSGVGTRPRPNRCSQTRLTITRAVSGFAGEASASANSRRPLPAVIGAGVSRAEHADKPARDDLSRLVELAAHVKRAIDGFISLADSHREGAGRAVAAVDGQAVVEHRDERVRPPNPISIPLARRDGVAFANEAGETFFHRGPLCRRQRGRRRGHMGAGRKLDQRRCVLRFWAAAWPPRRKTSTSTTRNDGPAIVGRSSAPPSGSFGSGRPLPWEKCLMLWASLFGRA